LQEDSTDCVHFIFVANATFKTGANIERERDDFLKEGHE
jgi:hypothetical protein